MKGMIQMCITLLGLFLMGAFSQSSCLSLPPTRGKGAGCGGAIGCAFGLFCHPDEGICVSLLKEGDDCEDFPNSCEIGTRCKGPSDFRRCIADVHPGEECSQSGSSSLPACGTGFCNSGICEQGLLGDACYEDDNCASNMTCVNRICNGIPLGAGCDASQHCVKDAYCDFETDVCTARKQSGSCDSDSECASGYYCIGTNVTNTNRQCVAAESRAAGEYCNFYDELCANSMRCVFQYCAAGEGNLCRGNSECAFDEACTCDKGELYDGVGRCSRSSCASIASRYSDCVYENCHTNVPSGSRTFFNGSCVEINCGSDYLAFRKCSGAAQIFVSLVSVSFFALLASLFSKHL